MQMTLRQSHGSMTRLLLVAAVLATVAVSSAALSLNPLLPAVFGALLIGALTLVERPSLGLMLTYFVFYINLQPILVNYHGVSVPIAAIVPLVPVLPLLAGT